MPEPGTEIEGPTHTLRLIKTADETGGELLEMEATYNGTGGMPPEHFHPSQAEHFEVHEGAIVAIIDGAERRYEAGESFDVPIGTNHQMTSDGPARVIWQVRPALRTAEFFERLYGEEPDSARELGAAFLEEFSDEVRSSAGDGYPPAPLSPGTWGGLVAPRLHEERPRPTYLLQPALAPTLCPLDGR